MTSTPYRYRRRLAGVFSLADLLAGSMRTGPGRPSLPTSPRLRRDVGLAELDTELPHHARLGRRP